MIDLEPAAGGAPRRSRTRIYLAAAAAVLAAAVAVTGVVVYRSSGTQVRFEAETGSGTAMIIDWNIGIEHVGRVSGDAARSSWSKTVTVETMQGTATLALRSADTDPVTCRILAEGKKVAELTQNRAAGCVFDLRTLAADAPKAQHQFP